MTDNYLDTVREALLAPAELSNEDLEKSLGILMAPGVDSADLYFQSMRQESWSLEDSIVKQGSYSINQGVGVRAIAGDKTGFAYSDEIVLPSLLRAAEAAAAIARSGNSKRLSAWKVPAAHQLYPMLDPLLSAVDDQKVALLQQADVLSLIHI